MKLRIQNILLIVILLGFINCEKKTQHILFDSRYKKEIEDARKEASVYLMMDNIPGATMAVCKDGKIIYSEGLGLSSKDLEVPVTRKTKFRIGAISELFTSLIYQLLIENGTLHADSTVQAYLRDYPESVYRGTLNRITLSQLAGHSAGIRMPIEEEQNWNGRNITVQNGIDLFKNDPLDFKPGWFEAPSNNDYNLLGAIMEKATGKNFPFLLTEYITDTLNLTNTEVDNPFKTVIGRSDFFDFNMIAQVIESIFIDMRYRAPSDGILSNAEDLVKFGNAVLSSDRISDQIKERLFVPTELMGEFPPNFANGWIVQKTKNGEFYYGKVGNVKGGSAILLLVPNKNLVLAMTTNMTSNNEIPLFKIFNSFLNEKDEKNR
ncbi:MAG: beta-lactamase family protein [Draconibacterium sp.]|nr:beta-lactamase family protein [Draconibacterium sp.]